MVNLILKIIMTTMSRYDFGLGTSVLVVQQRKERKSERGRERERRKITYEL